MSNSVDSATRPLSPASRSTVLNSQVRSLTPPSLWSRLALAAVVLLSIFMNFFALGQNGYGNLYYASGIRSMLDSWHNFFFVSFDPGGFVTIDKPPVGFWLQTLSAKIFGFTPFSIFLPQALCGVLAVLLLYALVRRHCGVVAGLVAALALAVSPISVVTDRNNTIDGTLALVLLVAAWALIHAAETGKLRWLLLSALIVGIGFNVKMSEAYLVVPALGITYLLCAPRKVWVRLVHLVLALAVMLVVSLSWAATVDAIPASLRPYVGSTQNNSELSLAFGYNGLNRLRIGGTAGPGGFGGTTGNARQRVGQGQGYTGSATGNGVSSGVGDATRRAGGYGGQFGGGAAGSGAFGGGGSAFNPLRLFSASYGGQIAWLLPFALLGIVALAWQRRFRFQRDRQQLALLLWGFWLLTMTVFFTLDASFHQYYMTVMAPGLCAMVGIGFVVMWQDFRHGGWRGWLLPIALLLTAVAQIAMLAIYPTWSVLLSPAIGIITVLVVVGLIAYRVFDRPGSTIDLARIGVASLVIGLLVLLVAPTIWSGYSVLTNTETSAPIAGPTARGIYTAFGTTGTVTAQGQGAVTGRGRAAFGGAAAGAMGSFMNGGGLSTGNEQSLISYLERNQGSAKFLVATPSASAADGIILATNKPVMSMGGFGGSDPILTTSSLRSLIANGTVRYFLLSAPRTTTNAIDSIIDGLPEQYQGFARGFMGGGQSTLTNLVTSNCKVVPSSEWENQTTTSTTGQQLYDCSALTNK
jgi:4-amino-4-deoxy-L-arabinose transferase and related glycosyltransferases of PMT family